MSEVIHKNNTKKYTICQVESQIQAWKMNYRRKFALYHARSMRTFGIITIGSNGGGWGGWEMGKKFIRCLLNTNVFCYYIKILCWMQTSTSHLLFLVHLGTWVFSSVRLLLKILHRTLELLHVSCFLSTDLFTINSNVTLTLHAKAQNWKLIVPVIKIKMST